ncbi:host attachment protein [Erythrobacter sp. HKB08]|uniref:baeRF12 domain-containing protein n=1 Tax=Erythrobacter sp. HKB08 TaxID=2502843 RepID=UPI001008D9ED|nr:host attachment protein [Erythrobacter sp. HKB08]
MKLPHKAHVALIDGENFTLYRNDGQIFEPKLTELEKPDLTATNFSAGVRHQDEIGQKYGSTQLDELAHGAAAAECLNSKCISGEIDDLLIIADPKTLGEMRHHYHSELEKRLAGEIDKTLTGEPIQRVEKAISEA